jgi:mannosyltransferase
VLGYRVGGVPAVVTEDVGRLVAPFDLDALATAVLAVVSDAGLRSSLSKAARARAVACFRTGPAVDRYEQLFRNLVMRPATSEP